METTWIVHGQNASATANGSFVRQDFTRSDGGGHNQHPAVEIESQYEPSGRFRPAGILPPGPVAGDSRTLFLLVDPQQLPNSLDRARAQFGRTYNWYNTFDEYPNCRAYVCFGSAPCHHEQGQADAR
jgi:hypothetical protein